MSLTPQSHGNGAGVGFGDTITRRLYDAIDFDAMYPNVLTSTVLKTANIPPVLKNNKQVFQAMVRTCMVT